MQRTQGRGRAGAAGGGGRRWGAGLLGAGALGAAVLGAGALGGCDSLRALAVRNYPQDYSAEAGAPIAARAAGPAGTAGTFDGPDLDRARLATPVVLQPLITGLSAPTDVQFPPGRSDVAVVLEKAGKARVFALGAEVRELGTLLDLPVPTRSEQGLLGLAFHPRFGPEGGELFVNHIVEATDTTPAAERTRVSRIAVTIAGDRWTAGPPRTVLELDQPYANHNAGQLAFGPDGMLYVGFGDGGWRDDPHGEGQDASGWLGSMLRIDVSKHDEDGRGYGVPADNPLRGQPGVPPETFATGLRNPWRYSFAPDGRLIVADVGQNLWEEVDVVGPGANLGWNLMEGRHCFPPERACDETGLTAPFWEYGHGEDGASVTGGYVYTGTAIPALQGHYVLGDFVSGRIWALPLPEGDGGAAPPVAAKALGHWRILISTFGRDGDGELVVADYGSGTVYRLVPGP